MGEGYKVLFQGSERAGGGVMMGEGYKVLFQISQRGGSYDGRRI